MLIDGIVVQIEFAGGRDMGFDVSVPSLALRPLPLKCARQPRRVGVRSSGLGESEIEDGRFEIQRIVDEAVAEVRAERRARTKVKPDARGARYQHPHLRPDRSGRQTRRHL